MRDEATAAAQREVTERIDRLERDHRSLALRDLIQRVRSLRGLAHASGLRAVVSLGYALEDELLTHGRDVAVADYLDRMRDAIDVEGDAEPRFVDLALATIGARLASA